MKCAFGVWSIIRVALAALFLVSFMQVAAAAEGELKAYKANTPAPALKLRDLNGKMHNLSAYRGQVVLVNFWASWCPPCLREMPSMQKLTERLAGRPFTALAINMAETPQTIRAFLATKAKINFPVLLDSDGAALKAWRVFVFPTSFIIDANGQIRYGVYGGLDWDAPEVMDKITPLLPAAH